MNLALLVIGDGRGEYLETCTQAVAHFSGWLDHAIMIDDSGSHDYGLFLDCNYPDYHVVHGGRRGMAGAVQAGFDAVLDTPATHVLWIEEDMQLLHPLPLRDAVRVLQSDEHLAQMCFRREPWWGSPIEMEKADQLAAIVTLADHYGSIDGYTWHDYLFSLNPCVIPRAVLEIGWDPDNEAGMTAKLLALGYRFGSWGYPTTPQAWARHIGEARSTGWRL